MENYFKNHILPWGLPKPSVNKNLSAESEKEISLLFSFMLQEAATALKVPHEVTITAISIFYKFYFKRTFQECNPLRVFPSIVYLSCKIEDELRRHRDVINVCTAVENKHLNKSDVVLDVTSSAYLKRKNTTVFLETIILKELGFNLYPLSNHAHSYLLYFVSVLLKEGTTELIRRVFA